MIMRSFAKAHGKMETLQGGGFKWWASPEKNATNAARNPPQPPNIKSTCQKYLLVQDKNYGTRHQARVNRP